ncbi:protein TIC 40, chloroplastic-like isoform X1 [Rutidosis leptorrhynchoides]|uniref:protein TIC 40, chloroplastic-like isoform X1 n=1 Tax=Rutidosis leptorrhynchoides TaxID=125765 RepID=UPI003A995A47
MENSTVYSSSSQKLVLGFTPKHRTNSTISKKPIFCSFKIPQKRTLISKSKTLVSAISHNQGSTPSSIAKPNDNLGKDCFAKISPSSNQFTSSVGATPPIAVPPPSSQVGSPLFWVGVGVALSAAFSWVASYLQKYATQQAVRMMMGQMNTQNNQFSNTGFSPGSPFPFPTPAEPGSSAKSPFPFPTPTSQGSAAASGPASQRTVTVDVPPKKIETPPAPAHSKDDFESSEPKKSAFVDVSPEETLKTSFEKLEESPETESPKESQFANQASQNGAAFKPMGNPFEGASSAGQTGPVMSVEALEKMLEDPTVQKMMYPYLPEEMRNPTSFKWMLQNPQYRQQLQEMLNSMGGSPEWDNSMMDSLKNFDISSPEVKEQFGNFLIKLQLLVSIFVESLEYRESNKTTLTRILIE